MPATRSRRGIVAAALLAIPVGSGLPPTGAEAADLVVPALIAVGVLLAGGALLLVARRGRSR